MKPLMFLATLLFSVNTFASSCPSIAGAFSCVFLETGKYKDLLISEENNMYPKFYILFPENVNNQPEEILADGRIKTYDLVNGNSVTEINSCKNHTLHTYKKITHNDLEKTVTKTRRIFIDYSDTESLLHIITKTKTEFKNSQHETLQYLEGVCERY